ncbi:M48 family peptidase [Helicobacter aurati]|uniref:M48 family peptidase n=1 Tax=Helicobacter aurati TaxID=137778 RepID=A0A3D8J657_9HELI|nr:M48 family metallopeptidase [Helicobacter aurati]RDU72384.1 M48 family peptidase [Helicobacter aurati]
MQEFLGFHFEILSNPRNKNSYIKLTRQGNLIFTYPLRFHNKLEHAKQYIVDNQEALKKHHQRLLKKQDEKQKILQEYLAQYLLRYPNTLRIFDTTYEVSHVNIESLSQILYNKSYSLLHEMANIMRLTFESLRISYAKSYLGQCHGRHIKIDYRNVLCPEYLLRYLIVHELSHIRFPNHSKSFWAEVATYYPNYKAARQEIKSLATKNTEVLQYYHLLPKKLQNHS